MKGTFLATFISGGGGVRSVSTVQVYSYPPILADKTTELVKLIASRSLITWG